MDIYKKFGTDPKKEVEGIWVDWDDETSFLIARWGNAKHRKAIEQYTKPYRTQLRHGQIPEKAATEIMNNSMSEAILLDWKGVYANDSELPYTVESAKTLLLNLPELSKFVQDVAQNLQLFQKEEDEAAEKN